MADDQTLAGRADAANCGELLLVTSWQEDAAACQPLAYRPQRHFRVRNTLLIMVSVCDYFEILPNCAENSKEAQYALGDFTRGRFLVLVLIY